MKWTYLMPATLVLSVGLATGCGSDDNKSSTLTLDQLCDKGVAACPASPVDAATCKALLASGKDSCATELSAVQTCAGSNPTFTCDPTIGAIPKGCEQKFGEAEACVILAGLGDAGFGGFNAGGSSNGGSSNGGASSGGAGGG
jgi:hypothetical protein